MRFCLLLITCVSSGKTGSISFILCACTLTPENEANTDPTLKASDTTTPRDADGLGVQPVRGSGFSQYGARA